MSSSPPIFAPISSRPVISQASSIVSIVPITLQEMVFNKWVLTVLSLSTFFLMISVTMNKV